MDNNSNNLSSLLQSNGSSSVSSTVSDNTNSSDGNGFFSVFTNISITTWILIILILAFLGFNIFVYLAKGTNFVESFFKPLLEKVLGLFAVITSKVVDVTAEGTKTVVNASATVVDKGLTSVQNVAQKVQPQQASSGTQNQNVQNVQQPPDVMSNNALNKSLNTSAQRQSKSNDEYQADESSSTIQSGTGKSGWCYIGEDRGFRSCAEVGQNDTCMSGDIFPSNEICVNPNLRS